MIDSDRRPVSNRRPLLKSASTADVIIANHSPIQGYSQIGVRSKLSDLFYAWFLIFVQPINIYFMFGVKVYPIR